MHELPAKNGLYLDIDVYKDDGFEISELEAFIDQLLAESVRISDGFQEFIIDKVS